MVKRHAFARLIGAGLTAAFLATAFSISSAIAQQPADQTTKTKAKRPVSPGVAAMRERQKKCGAEWKADKAAGKIEKGLTWPKYWSACNKRLKAAKSG